MDEAPDMLARRLAIVALLLHLIVAGVGLVMVLQNSRRLKQDREKQAGIQRQIEDLISRADATSEEQPAWEEALKALQDEMQGSERKHDEALAQVKDLERRHAEQGKLVLDAKREIEVLAEQVNVQKEQADALVERMAKLVRASQEGRRHGLAQMNSSQSDVERPARPLPGNGLVFGIRKPVIDDLGLQFTIDLQNVGTETLRIDEIRLVSDSFELRMPLPTTYLGPARSFTTECLLPKANLPDGALGIEAIAAGALNVQVRYRVEREGRPGQLTRSFEHLSWERRPRNVFDQVHQPEPEAPGSP